MTYYLKISSVTIIEMIGDEKSKDNKFSHMGFFL